MTPDRQSQTPSLPEECGIPLREDVRRHIPAPAAHHPLGLCKFVPAELVFPGD